MALGRLAPGESRPTWGIPPHVSRCVQRALATRTSVLSFTPVTRAPSRNTDPLSHLGASRARSHVFARRTIANASSVGTHSAYAYGTERTK